VKASGPPLVELDDGLDDGPDDGPDGRVGDGATGATPAGGIVWGTSLHGLLESDGARAALLERVARKAGKRIGHGGSFEDARQQRIDRLADALEAHVDIGALDRILADGAAR
jgi:adenosylcobyric acid synthase